MLVQSYVLERDGVRSVQWMLALHISSKHPARWQICAGAEIAESAWVCEPRTKVLVLMHIDDSECDSYGDVGAAL